MECFNESITLKISAGPFVDKNRLLEEHLEGPSIQPTVGPFQTRVRCLGKGATFRKAFPPRQGG